ncbi:MAG: hypothetical protein Q9168_005123 [Polycauliona sp. 1 TL-2023]
MCFPKSSSGGGNALQRSTSEEKKKNMEIERLLRKDKKMQARQVKILLLGAGESGKSTILKQMRIIYSEGFHLEERKEVRQVIFSNMVVAFKIIAEEMREIGMDYQDPASHEHERVIAAAEDIGTEDSFPPQGLSAMKALWHDPSVQATIKRGNEYALHDNIQYYYNNIDRLFAKDYLPNDQDVLRSRLRTTGITETLFELGQLKYHMFDVGGQRSERKKWVHCFEGVHCLMFVAALSGYDQCLVEDKTANQMQEALLLFESIMSLTWFKRSSIILFLNKIDLFKEKLADKPVKDYFPDYVGSDDDYNAASQYFANKFRSLNRTEDREIYVHFTNATDTNLLKITMQSVQDTIIQSNLNALIVTAAAKHTGSKHQRNHSSSKASSSSKGDPRPLGAASEASSNERPAAPLPAERRSRRTSRIAPKSSVAQIRREAYPNVPSVPSTQHLHPQNIQVASFFSHHRPISITRSFPSPSSNSQFSSIFESRSPPKSPIGDVISTVSSAIESLENAVFEQQPSSSGSQSLTPNYSETIHLDAAPQQIPLDISELSKSFRPFVPPPAPVAFDDIKPAPTKRNKGVKERSFSTTLTIIEQAHPNGQRVYQAQISPMREDLPSLNAHSTPSSSAAAPLQQNDQYENIEVIDITPPSGRQPFLEHLEGD